VLTFALKVVFELIGMLAKPVRIPLTKLRRIPNPTVFSWPAGGSSIIFSVLRLYLNTTPSNLGLRPGGGFPGPGGPYFRELKEQDQRWVDVEDLHRQLLVLEEMLQTECNKEDVLRVMSAHLQIGIGQLNSGSAKSSIFTTLLEAPAELQPQEFVRLYLEIICPLAVEEALLAAEKHDAEGNNQGDQQALVVDK
jgi:hypothetical protein